MSFYNLYIWFLFFWMNTILIKNGIIVVFGNYMGIFNGNWVRALGNEFTIVYIAAYGDYFTIPYKLPGPMINIYIYIWTILGEKPKE